MLGKYGKAERTGGRSINSNELEIPEPDVRRETRGGSDIPTADASTVTQTAQDLKRKVFNLVGAKNRLKVCLYPINKNRECRAYENIDAAAKAACNL